MQQPADEKIHHKSCTIRTCFIQNNNFERWIGIIFFLASILHNFVIFFLSLLDKKTRGRCFGRVLTDRQTSKMLNFITYNRDTSFIGCIKFQDSPFQNRRRIQLLAQCQGNRSFSAARRSVLSRRGKDER